MGELQKSFAVLDILPDNRLVGGVKFGHRAKTEEPHRAAGKLLPDSRPLPCRERRFNAVPVGRPKLNRLESGLSTIFDDGRDIPVFREVVGDEPEPGFGRIGEQRLIRQTEFGRHECPMGDHSSRTDRLLQKFASFYLAVCLAVVSSLSDLSDLSDLFHLSHLSLISFTLVLPLQP